MDRHAVTLAQSVFTGKGIWSLPPFWERIAAMVNADFPASPYEFFDACYAKAQSLKIPQAEAMVLITASPDAKPSGRIVLLKESVRDRGFRFFTNYDSRKSNELLSNPQAQLLFYWPSFGRQIRIEGKVVRLSAADSDAYWYSRPRGSRIGAIASKQSQPLDSMESLRMKVGELEKSFEGKEVPRPENWGGVRASRRLL